MLCAFFRLSMLLFLVFMFLVCIFLVLSLLLAMNFFSASRATVIAFCFCTALRLCTAGTWRSATRMQNTFYKRVTNKITHTHQSPTVLKVLNTSIINYLQIITDRALYFILCKSLCLQFTCVVYVFFWILCFSRDF